MGKIMHVNYVFDELVKWDCEIASSISKFLSIGQMLADSMLMDQSLEVSLRDDTRTRKISDSELDTIPMIFVTTPNITKFDIYSDKERIRKISDIKYIKIESICDGINIKLKLIPSCGDWVVESESYNLNKLMSLNKTIHLQIISSFRPATKSNGFNSYDICYGFTVDTV